MQAVGAGPQFDGLGQRPLPGGERLAGQAVDQVQVHVLESRPPGGAIGLARLRRRVDAPEQAQLVVLKRLDAQAQAVEAQPAQAIEAGAVRRAGVGFGRDLGVGRQAE
jgi:hypothetical protein